MIYTCPVKGCGVMHEMGSDHLNEPCTSCWREGWRTDAFGNVYNVLDEERIARERVAQEERLARFHPL